MPSDAFAHPAPAHHNPGPVPARPSPTPTNNSPGGALPPSPCLRHRRGLRPRRRRHRRHNLPRLGLRPRLHPPLPPRHLWKRPRGHPEPRPGSGRASGSGGHAGTSHAICAAAWGAPTPVPPPPPGATPPPMPWVTPPPLSVESLPARGPRPRRFLWEPRRCRPLLWGRLQPPPEAIPSPVAPAVFAKKLGRYEIIGVLGRGGMATVYRARHRDWGKRWPSKCSIRIWLQIRASWDDSKRRRGRWPGCATPTSSECSTSTSSMTRTSLSWSTSRGDARRAHNPLR